MEPAPKRVLFYVQHLLGIGHLQRASVLVRAMLRAGLDVTVVRGGVAEDFDFGSAATVQLPPVQARDAETYRLVDEHGRRIGPLYWWRRRRELLRAFRDVAPHAVIVEMFPFGRMQFRGELVALLRIAAKANAVRISSMRDIVEPRSRRDENERMVALAEKHFDRLLIHGDPTLMRLEQSLPAVARIADRLDYTGYVVGEVPPHAAAEATTVLVSVGGGAVGEHLLRTALGARPLTRHRARPWHLLCGVNVDAARVAALQREAPEGVLVERHREDFRSLLRTAAVSVSQAGYNTAVELIAAGVPSVLVPFVADRETEQTRRARALEARGLATVVAEASLTPETLARAIDDAVSRPARAAIDLGGAERTARIVHNAIDSRIQVRERIAACANDPVSV